METTTIVDQQGNPLDNYDPDLGYLETHTEIIHHPADEAVAEVSHYVPVQEFPATGGRIVQKVIDVPGVEAQEAWDEPVTTQVYIPYTAAELAARDRARRIAELKRSLSETDYTVIKIAEGSATAEEYAAVIEQRRAWRAEINRLEAEGQEV